MLHGRHSPQPFPSWRIFLLLNVQGSDKREDDSSCPEHGGNVADTSTTQVLEEHDETHAKITSFQVGFRSPHPFTCPSETCGWFPWRISGWSQSQPLFWQNTIISDVRVGHLDTRAGVSGSLQELHRRGHSRDAICFSPVGYRNRRSLPHPQRHRDDLYHKAAGIMQAQIAGVATGQEY